MTWKSRTSKRIPISTSTTALNLGKTHYTKVLTDCKPHKESRHLQNKKAIHPHKEDDKTQNPTPKCTWRVKYDTIEEVQIAKKKILK